MLVDGRAGIWWWVELKLVDMVVELKDKQNSGFHRLARPTVYQHRTNFALCDAGDDDSCRVNSVKLERRKTLLGLATGQDETVLVACHFVWQ